MGDIGWEKSDLKLSFGNADIKFGFNEKDITTYNHISFESKDKRFKLPEGKLRIGNFSFYWYNFEYDKLVYFVKLSFITDIKYVDTFFSHHITFFCTVGKEINSYHLMAKNRYDLKPIYDFILEYMRKKEWAKKIENPRSVDALLFNNDIDVYEINRTIANSNLKTVSDLKKAQDKIENAISVVQSFSKQSKIKGENSDKIDNTEIFNFNNIELPSDCSDTAKIISGIIESSNGIISTINLYGLYQRYIKSYDILSPAEFMCLLKQLSSDNNFKYELYQYTSPVKINVMRSNIFF